MGIARQLTGSGALKVGSLVTGFALSVVLVRAIGAEGFGYYALALAIIQLAGLPTKAGLPTLLMRESAAAANHNNNGLQLFINVFGQRLVWAYSAIAIVVLAAVLLLWRGDATTASVLWAGLALIPILGFMACYMGILKGLEQPVKAQAPELAIRHLMLLLLVALAMLLGWPDLTPISVMLLTVAACFVSLLILRRWFRAAATKQPSEITDYKHLAPIWRRNLVYLTGFSGLKLVDLQLNLILVSLWVSAEMLGQFRVAAQIAPLMILGLTVINMVIGPRFVRSIQAGDIPGLWKTYFKMAALSGGAAGLALIFLLWQGQWVLLKFYGEDFSAIYWPLIIMACGQVVNAAAGSIGIMLQMAGQERRMIASTALALTVSVGLTIILTPSMGVMGAAIAYAASNVIWNGALIITAIIGLGIKGKMNEA